MIVMATGHRPFRLKGQEKEIKEWFAERLAFLHPEVCICGMADGADMLFATAAMMANIELWCYFSGKGFEYHRKENPLIFDYATSVACFDDFDKRDKAMVDDSNIVLAVYDGNPCGGTYTTIQYAIPQNKQIYYYPFIKEEERS